MANMGAPTKYCPEIVKSITDDLKQLSGRVRAAKNAGINYQTFCDWMKDKADFSESIKKAEKEANEKIKSKAVMKIVSAMDEQWTAAAWMLERKWHKEYGKQHLQIEGDINITGEGGKIA